MIYESVNLTDDMIREALIQSANELTLEDDPLRKRSSPSIRSMLEEEVILPDLEEDMCGYIVLISEEQIMSFVNSRRRGRS